MFRYSQRWLIIDERMNGIDVVTTELQDLEILLDSEVTVAREVGESVFELYLSKYKRYHHQKMSQGLGLQAANSQLPQRPY